MKIRSLLPKVILCLAALTAGHQARATPVANYTYLYAIWELNPAATYSFTYGANENFPIPPDYWNVELLTIAGFSNSSWGSSYTLDAGNTASFAAFTAFLTDGEEDWIGGSINGGAVYGPDSSLIFTAGNSPFGVDLIGYDISEITLQFEEDHFFDYMNPQVQGKYTITFSGSVVDVPDAGSTLGLIAASVGLMHLSRRRWYQG